jgi:tetratricopeptide (TPR) repeat protein
MPLAASLPLLMIFASRAQPGEPVRRVRQAAAALAPMPLLDLPLAALDGTHSAMLLANLAGAQVLPAALRDQILRKTEGNPFFIEEVIRSLVSDGVLERGTAGWQMVRRVEDVQLPDTLLALILSRIDRLDDETKHAIKLASVIGRSFYERVLEAIFEARSALERSLAELQHAELIREKQRQPDLEYIFKHALVQEAAYGSMLAENRRGIHRHVAQAIERLFPERLDEFASLLAHHYTCAEDWEQAQGWLFRAGDQAGRLAADDEALDHLRRAEAAYLKVHGERLAPLQRAALARKVGTALFGTGQYEAAHAQMRQALGYLGVHYPDTRGGVLRAVLRHVGGHMVRRWRDRLGMPAPRRMDTAVATEISTIAHTMAWTDYFLDKERMLLDSLMELDAGENSDHALAEARGLSAVGFGLMTYGARRLARGYHQRALALAQRSGHASAIAFAWMALAFVDFYDGRWDDFESRMGRAVTGFRESGDLHRWGSPVMMVAWAGIARGRLAEAKASMQEAVQIGIDAADPQITSWALQVLGRALLQTGPLAEAEAVLRRGCAIARDIHSVDNLLHLQAMLVECLVMQGRLDEGEPLLAEAFELMRRERMDRDFDRVELLVADAMHALARAESTGGAPARAQTACAKALRCARRMPLWLPQALRLQGTADWLAGRQAAARAAWAESLAQAVAQSFPVERALTLLEQGRRTGDATLQAQAEPLFSQAGAEVLLGSGRTQPQPRAA